MVNFGEGISLAKALLVQVDCSFCYAENQGVAKILCQRLTHEDPLGSIHRIIVSEDFEVACTDSIQVTRDPWSGFKLE